MKYQIMRIVVILLSLVLVLLVDHTSNAQPDQLSQETVSVLIEIRTAYSLQSIYPDDTTFCTRNTNIIKCDSERQNITFLRLDGGGTVHLPFSVTTLNSLDEIELKNTFVDLIPDFFGSLPVSIRNLSCNRCNITTIDPQRSNLISKIVLIDNPVEGYLHLANFSALVEFHCYSTDPSFIREVHFGPNPANNLMKFQSTLSSFFNFSKLTPNIHNITIHLGQNFDESSISLLEIIKAQVPPLMLVDTRIGSERILLNFPKIEKWNRPSSIAFKNIKFAPLSGRPNLSNCTDLQIFTLIDCDTVGNNIYPFIHPRLQFITLDSCGLTQLPPSDMFSYGLNLFSLKNNLINQALPLNFKPSSSFYAYELGGNQLYGPIDASYCPFYVDFTGNSMSGTLPSCFACHLADTRVSSMFSSSSFTNYQPGGNIPPCTTLTIQQPVGYAQGSIHIDFEGTDLGLYEDRIFPDPDVFPYYSLYFEIPNKRISLSSNFNVMVNATKNKSIKLFFKDLNNASLTLSIKFLPPIINSISNFYDSNITGYVLLISGGGFQSPCTVKLGQYDCLVQANKFGPNFISCSLPGTSTLEEQYYPVTVTNPDGQSYTYQYPFVRSFPTITSISSPPTTGGPVTIVGMFGENFTHVSLLIGGVSCTIEFINSTTIFSRVGPGSGIKDVYLTVAGMVMKRYGIFAYEGEKFCGGCSGNGVCLPILGCSCYYGWTGPMCSDKVVPSNSSHGLNGTQIEAAGIKFGFRVAGIRELDTDGTVIREITFANWTLESSIQPNYKLWTYFYDNFDTEGTNISYSVREYTSPDEVIFAGIPLEMNVGSLKLTSTISQWPYLKSTNSIEFMIESYSLTESDCSEEISATEIESTVKYFTIMRDGKVLYARFIDRVLSDGRSTFSRTRVINQTESGIFIGIGLPYCVKECILDPDFSVLVQENSGCSKDNNHRIVIISVSVVVSVVGASALIIAFFALRRKVFFKFSFRHGLVFMWKSSDVKDPNSSELESRR